MWELLDYTARKYGEDKVAQIITFGTLGARAAIRDVGRVMDIPLPEVDRIAKVIPSIPGKPVTIPEALETVPSLQEAYQSSDYIQELIETAAKLEGVARNAGTHAAGVIVTDKPITEYIPLHRPTKGSQEDNPIRAVTQFEMGVLESLGLLKIDYLGLSTLTVMARACELIRKRHGVELDINSIPLDESETYDLLGSGDVLGVFQVEGAGMRRYLMEMKPRNLAHVTAMVALYRPGPMEFIPAYIRRMHGQEDVTYRHPCLKPILEETYGITVYQEQIMYTAMNLAGYTASEADNLRKAVAKKKAKALREQRQKFVEGAVANEIPQETADTIFDDWEAFARYGFPKGHAADYAVICVQTACLKATYPLEYMAALLSVYKGVTDRVALYAAECRRMGLKVLPPSVDRSGLDFEIEDHPNGDTVIRYGLGAIKNVGQGAVETIIQARPEEGFANLEDFARRADLRQVGKRAMESLIRVGALDELGARLDLLESLDRIMSYSISHFRAGGSGPALDLRRLDRSCRGISSPASHCRCFLATPAWLGEGATWILCFRPSACGENGRPVQGRDPLQRRDQRLDARRESNRCWRDLCHPTLSHPRREGDGVPFVRGFAGHYRACGISTALGENLQRYRAQSNCGRGRTCRRQPWRAQAVSRYGKSRPGKSRASI